MSRGPGRLNGLPSPGMNQVPRWDLAEAAPAEARADQGAYFPDPPMPVWVWLWHRTPGHYRAKADALGWTADQVWVRYVDHEGREGFVWVWASAVKRR